MCEKGDKIFARGKREREGGRTNLREGRERGIEREETNMYERRGRVRDKFARGGKGEGRDKFAREEKTFDIDTLATSTEKLKRNLTF